MDGLNNIQWMLTLVFSAAFLVLYFMYLCVATGVLQCFGRKALDSSSISYLSLMGCVPALYTLTLIEAPTLLNITSPWIAMLLMLMCALSAKTLMLWLAQGIEVPFAVEVDE